MSDARDLAPKIADFLSELEALSRKHGLWVEPHSPETLPRLRPSWGCEQGYNAFIRMRGMGRDTIHFGLQDDEEARRRVMDEALAKIREGGGGPPG